MTIESLVSPRVNRGGACLLVLAMLGPLAPACRTPERATAAIPAAQPPGTTTQPLRQQPPSGGRRPNTSRITEPAASSSAASSPQPCPPEMADFGAYCIDRYEAHLIDRQTLARHPHAERPDPGRAYLARSQAGVFPQGYLDRSEAARACGNSGKRLCSLREWYRACAGAPGGVYPYGNEQIAGACNVGKPHLLGRLFGADPHRWRYAEHFNSPALNREPGFLAAAGAYSHCRSEEGVFDMVGNLHEWVADPVDFTLAEKLPVLPDIQAKISTNLGKGIFMGGFYSTSSEHGRGCRFLTPGHEPRYHDYSTGFRCCRDTASP